MSSISVLKTNDSKEPFSQESENIVDYININKKDVISFLKDRGFDFIMIPEEQFLNAAPIGSGISGAKKIELQGKVYVIKAQDLAPDFKGNLLGLLARNTPIDHCLVSESDDSFADFPRKEILGVRIASALGIEVPSSQLVSINKAGVAALQEFLPKERAIVMKDQLQSLGPGNIDFQSAINIVFFHIITENIDGHSGNILLAHFDKKDSDEDDFDPDFKAIPIDFSLIFPRHQSVYPKEINLVQKDFFHFFENKTIFVEENLRPLVASEKVLNDPEIRGLARDHELCLLNRNFRVMQNIADQQKGKKMRVREFFNTFVSNVLLSGQK